MIKKALKYLTYLKIFSLPLVTIAICTYLLSITHREISQAILEGTISGAIFYAITVSIPTYKQKELAKRIAVDSYCQTKEDMLKILLTFLRKYSNDIINQSIRNYLPIRQHITQDDLYYLLNNLSTELVKEQLYYLDQLRDVLIQLTAYDFIRNNKTLFIRIKNLIYWIKQFSHNCNPEALRVNYDVTSKAFVNFINEFLRGSSNASGKRDQDDFIELLEHA